MWPVQACHPSFLSFRSARATSIYIWKTFRRPQKRARGSILWPLLLKNLDIEAPKNRTDKAPQIITGATVRSASHLEQRKCAAANSNSILEKHHQNPHWNSSWPGFRSDIVLCENVDSCFLFLFCLFLNEILSKLKSGYGTRAHRSPPSDLKEVERVLRAALPSDEEAGRGRGEQDGARQRVHSAQEAQAETASQKPK